MSNILDQPSRKMFLIDLVCGVDITEDATPGAPVPSYKKWSVYCSGVPVEFTAITVQGVVIEVKDGGDSVLLDDGTAIAHINGCMKMPFVKSMPVKGQYLMVVGMLQQSGRIPVVRCIKLQNLTHNVYLGIIWPIEVLDGLNQLSDHH